MYRLGNDLTAFVHRDIAARRKGAARRQVGEVGRRAGDRHQPAALRRGMAGARGKQPSRVGMRRRADHGRAGAHLDDAAAVHHRDAVRHFDRDADVVGNEDYAQPQLALQFAQQQQHLDLHRGVERGGRLVGQQHLGPAGERERDHRALAHAARHFVRIVVEPPLGRRECGPARTIRARACGLPRCDEPSCRFTASAIWSPTR